MWIKSTSGAGPKGIRWPVSRVLCRPRRDADATVIPLDRSSPNGSRDLPGRLGRRDPARLAAGATPLFGLAPGGACHAVPVTRSAVGSYPTLSPLPSFALRTPEGEPFVVQRTKEGGLLSVALSLGSPPAGVTRRLFAVEPGLSSLPPYDERATARPSDPGSGWAYGGGASSGAGARIASRETAPICLTMRKMQAEMAGQELADFVPCQAQIHR